MQAGPCGGPDSGAGRLGSSLSTQPGRSPPKQWSSDRSLTISPGGTLRGIFPSLLGRAQRLHVGGHPWQVIRPGGAAMGAEGSPRSAQSQRAACTWLCLGASHPGCNSASKGAHGFPTPARSTGSSPTDSPDLPGSWTSRSLQWLVVCLHFPLDHTAPHLRAPHHRATEPCWSWDTCPFFERLGQVKAAR